MPNKSKKNRKGGTKKNNNTFSNNKKTMKLSTPNFKEKHLILYKQLKEPRVDLKHKKTNRIKKKLRFGKTTIKNYILDSPEKLSKKASPIEIKECYYTDRESDFPCKYQHTIFNTIDEYNEYKKMKDERNAVTGYKHRSMHYNEILGNTNRIQKNKI
jgi:hypothetical protein